MAARALANASSSSFFGIKLAPGVPTAKLMTPGATSVWLKPLSAMARSLALELSVADWQVFGLPTVTR